MRATVMTLAGLALTAGAPGVRAEESQTRLETPSHAYSGATTRTAEPRAHATTHVSAAFSSGRGSGGRASSPQGLAAQTASGGIQATSISPSGAGSFGPGARSLGYTASQPTFSGVAPVLGGTKIQSDGAGRPVNAGPGVTTAKEPDKQSSSGSADDPLTTIVKGIGNMFKSMADMFSN